MPRIKDLVINTGPLLALAAALDTFEPLKELYSNILVPSEVDEELFAAGSEAFGLSAYTQAEFLTRISEKVNIDPFLSKILDRGEASVISLARRENITTVCIDEAVGRRYARLYGLNITGSLGILLKASKVDKSIDVEAAIGNMRRRGVWLSDKLIAAVLKQISET
jgi:predicted nucleic acid-binding protein